jgi:hypothetical protein
MRLLWGPYTADADAVTVFIPMAGVTPVGGRWMDGMDLDGWHHDAHGHKERSAASIMIPRMVHWPWLALPAAIWYGHLELRTIHGW